MKTFARYLWRHGAPAITGQPMGRFDRTPTVAGIAAGVEQARNLAVEALLSQRIWPGDLPSAQLTGLWS